MLALTRWRRLALAALAAMALAAVGGCGDDEDTSSASTTSGTAAATTAASDDFLMTQEPPTSVKITEPLARTPEPGKRIVFLQVAVGNNIEYTRGMQGAARALGWTVKVMGYEAGKSDAAIRSAVAQNPDFIVGSAMDVAPSRAGLAAAHKAGIPVGSIGTADRADPETGFTAVTSGHFLPDAIGLLDYVAKDSGGDAKILFVNLPVVAVLKADVDDSIEWLAENCPDCTSEVLDASPEQFGSGRVPSLIVSKLQSDPDIDYVFYTFPDIYTGATPALKAAGLLDRVKQVVQVGNESVLTDLRNGDVAATTQLGVRAQSWDMMDWLARLANGEEITDEYVELQRETKPSFLLLKDNDALIQEMLDYGQFGFPGPPGFEDQYKEQWGVTGS